MSATTPDEGREARMAQRASQRRVERPQDSWNWDAVIWFQRMEREDRARIRASMTLGDLAECLGTDPIACACVGPPGCCINVGKVQQELQRGAHITARLVADLFTRRLRDVTNEDHS